MTWLRYMLDRIVARFEPHCPDDWTDCHDPCECCERIEQRNARLAFYRLSKRTPRARVKVRVS